jgi:hypothetical protein
VLVNGQAAAGVAPASFHRVEREWQNGDRVEIRLPMEVRTSTWFQNSIAVERGPLVYALKIGEQWRKIKQTGPAADWEVYPATPWNYALSLDTAKPASSFEVAEKPVGRQPYSAEGAPVEITARARRLPDWQTVDDSAGPLPLSPVSSKRPEETITLIPYGAAKLRITAFPFLAPAAATPAR